MTKAKMIGDAAIPQATVVYMTAVNKWLAWCERVRPPLNTYVYAQWAQDRDTILRDLDDKRRVLAELYRNEDGGCNSPVWDRLARGDFEEAGAAP